MYNELHFYVPHVTFGQGLSKKTSTFVKKLGGSKALVVYDIGIKKAGIVDPITEALEADGITIVEFDKVMADPTTQVVDEATKTGITNHVDVVIAIGGGSVLDTAKAAKMLIPNGGLCLDFIAENKGVYPFEKAGLPLIAIPTTSGTGSEVTPCSVVTDTDRNQKVMVADFDKMFVDQTILDPELVQGLPASITAACGMDVLSHATEGYLSPFATPFTDAFNLHAIGLCRKSLPKAVKNGTDLDARADMMIASTIAGAGVGNANAHLGHGMAHAMGAGWHIPHGVGCALALPYMFEHVSEHQPKRARQIADAFGCIVPPNASPSDIKDILVAAIRSFNKEIGIPSAVALGKCIDDLENIMEYTRHEWDLCQLSGVPFTEEHCTNYYTDLLTRI